MLRLLLLSALAAVTAPTWALDTLAEIGTCVQGNVPQRTVEQDIAFLHYDRSGRSRRLVGRMWARRNDRALLDVVLKIREPDELRGAAYLLLEGSGRIADRLLGRDDDRIYIYLPAARAVRRISASDASGQLFGTNLEYGDFRHLLGSVREVNAERLPDTELAGRKAYALRVVPAEPTSPYSEIRSFIDARTCLALQVDFIGHDRRPARRLRMNPDHVARVDGRFVGHEYRIDDLRSGEHTMIYFGDVHYDDRVDETFFHPDGFHLAR